LILIPLAVSLFVRARYAEQATQYQPFFAQASNFSLLLLLVLMVVLNFSDVIGLLGSGGLLASLILVVLTTAGGYLLGRLANAGSWIQGLGAGQRNIAAASGKPYLSLLVCCDDAEREYTSDKGADQLAGQVCGE
jgi:predicted Na+-dependent transporter